MPNEVAGCGPVALDGADPDDVDGLLNRGCVGISLPAGALAGPDRLDRIGAVLERAAVSHARVLVHPGRAPGQPAAGVEFGEPVWWRPLTSIFYETSSNGPAAIEMTARRVGESRLVCGSGWPVLEPATTGRETLLQANGAALLTRIGAAA